LEDLTTAWAAPGVHSQIRRDSPITRRLAIIPAKPFPALGIALQMADPHVIESAVVEALQVASCS
jgi:hypothetical protein